MKNTDGSVRRDRSRKGTNYRRPNLSVKEKALIAGEAVLIGGLICWLCYHSVFFAPVGAAAAAAVILMKRKEALLKQKQTLLYHFKDTLASLNVSLKAGYSLENALFAARQDIKDMYGKEDIMYRELEHITSALQVRVSAEEMFRDLGERSGLEDIQLFGSLLGVARRSGGGISRVIEDTARIICDKIDVRQEIDTMVSSKVFEQKIMCIMPACIIVYLRLTFSGFIELLYGNTFGIIVMSACLAVYSAAFYWGRRLVDIEV